MQNPKFSIVIPVYNAKDFIAEAIDSAINQSYGNIEIICVDDKSIDNSASIIKEFMAKDERIKLICNERNLGTFATRNKGALNASGEYLLFLDADDMLNANACERLGKELQLYNDIRQKIDILAFNHIVEKENGQKAQKNFNLLYPKNKIFSIKDFVLESVKNGIGKYWTLWGKAFLHTTYTHSLQNLDLNQRLLMAEDALNFVNVLFYAKNYACINDELYIYKDNENSITQRNDKEKLLITIQNHSYVIDTLLDLSEQFSPFERYLAQIFCIELEISNINFAKRKLNPSLLNYLSTSFYKKFLRLKQKYYIYKFSLS